MKKHLILILILISISSCTVWKSSVKDGHVETRDEIGFLPNTGIIESLVDAFERLFGLKSDKMDNQLDDIKKLLERLVNKTDPGVPVLDDLSKEEPTEQPDDDVEQTDTASCPKNGDGSKECPFTNTRFSHTQYDPNHKKDGGKSLVTCPDQGKAYERCYVGMVPIPWHRIVENGRGSYWNMSKAPEGNVTCIDFDGKYHEFPSPKGETIYKSKWKLPNHKCKP